MTVGQPQTLGVARPALAAAYVRDDGGAAAVCVCDLALATGSGAALGGIAPARAAEQVSGGRMEPELREHFHEVATALARLLNSPTTPHLRLADVHSLPGELPEGAAGVVLDPGERVDYQVTIDGYGPGCLTVLAR